MFLKIATVIAIVGVALSLFLSLIQRALVAGRFYSAAFVMFSQLIGMVDLVLLNGGLLVFLVAFLLNLRTKTS